MRADKPELNKKGNEVNNHLKEMWKKKEFFSNWSLQQDQSKSSQ